MSVVTCMGELVYEFRKLEFFVSLAQSNRSIWLDQTVYANCSMSCTKEGRDGKPFIEILGLY